MYQMYAFIREFNCSPAEYEERPYKESQWLLAIHRVHGEAEHDVQERATRK